METIQLQFKVLTSREGKMLSFQSLLVGLAVFCITAYTSYRYRYRKFYALAAKIPGPKGLPLIGNGLIFIGKSFKEYFSSLVDLAPGFESPAKVWLGPILFVTADTPEIVKKVFNSEKCLDKSFIYSALRLVKGLLIGGGNMWKLRRKIWNPSFNVNLLQNFIPTFNEKAQVMIKNLEKYEENYEFDFYDKIAACTLETLLKTNLDIDRDIQSSEKKNNYLVCIDM